MRALHRLEFVKELRREAHISALQACKKAPPRLPLALSDRKWPQNPGKPQVARPQTFVGLNKQSSLLPEPGTAKDVVKVSRLIKRADFLRLAKGRRYAAPGLVLQMQASPATASELRIGFTATKKLGNAVVRNRVKRRLREVARAVMPGYATNGCDYVLIAREATSKRLYAALIEDLKLALLKVHGSHPKKVETV